VTARTGRATAGAGAGKEAIAQFWDREPCGTRFEGSEAAPRYSREYFEAQEAFRYGREPEIFSFAQFTRYHGQRVLEVGVGAGADFLQWVRAGADAHGIDLTPEGIHHARERLAAYGLRAADLRVADCEALPYADDTFDLVYSWGVVHHTPDTRRAVAEIVRVCRPGGRVKLMIYHRRSLFAFFLWLRWALLAGRPWRSRAWCLAHRLESPGTKAFTRSEAAALLIGLPVSGVRIRTLLTAYDTLIDRGAAARALARVLAAACGRDRAGWFMTIELTKRTSGPSA
jgi:SAM-dependent methyltransferase